jgi:hypothetical protein
VRADRDALKEAPVRRKKKPLLSACGNPFPAGLPPVRIRYAVPGVAGDVGLATPIVEEDLPRPPADCIVTDDYLYEQFPPGSELPRLKLRLAPRERRQSAEQYAHYRRGVERHTLAFCICLGLMQQLCTVLRNHRTCAHRLCRRQGACRGRRDEDRHTLPILHLSALPAARLRDHGNLPCRDQTDA